MAVKCPALEWPSTLDERGPSEDPSILLTGTARVGGAPVAIMAIRINAEFRQMPDYKSGLPAEVYETAALETILEEFEYLAEELRAVTGRSERSLVRLETGSYMVWMYPAR